MEEIFLKKGLQEQNKIVFDFVFEYYYSGLCAFAETILNEQSLAEDVVQDLFVNLWFKSNQLTINGPLKNYLFRAVKNSCLDYIKHKKVKARFFQAQQLAEHTKPDSPEVWFAETELQELIDKSIEKMPPRCSEIFKMSRFEGLKNQEIADKLNLSKRTVEIQISNALKTLRYDLRPYLPVFLLCLI